MQILYRLLQCTWGLPQTLAGAFVFILNRECTHYSYKGSIVTEWKSKSSLSLGMFLFVSDDPFFITREKERIIPRKRFLKC